MSSLPITRLRSSTSVGGTVYTTLLRARMSMPTVSIVFVRFGQHNRRWRQLRPLVLTRCPLWRHARRSLPRWRRSSRCLLRSASVIGRLRWIFPNISGRRVSWQQPGINSAILVVAWPTFRSRRSGIAVFTPTYYCRSRTTARTFWPSTKLPTFLSYRCANTYHNVAPM